MANFNGNQGYVKFATRDGQKVVIKKSKYVDYTVELEKLALSRLIGNPHVCQIVEGGRPDRLLTRRIEGKEFNSYLRNKKATAEQKLDAVYAALAAIHLVHETTGISHNDLHTSNILIEKTNVDYVVFNFGAQKIVIPTHGVRPVIIDFGLSYVPHDKMLMTTNFTDIGYFPFETDRLGDAKILTVDAADIFASLKINKPFVTAVKRVWKPLPLNRGWFKDRTFGNIADDVTDALFRGENVDDDRLRIFDRYKNKNLDETVGLLMAQISLPLTKYDIELNDANRKRLTDARVKLDESARFTEDELVASVAFDAFADEWLPEAVDHDVPRDELKNLKNRLDTKMPERIKPMAQLLIKAMSNVVFEMAKEMSEKRAKMYETVAARTVLDVLNAMPMRKVTIQPGTNVEYISAAGVVRYDDVSVETIAKLNLND